MVEQLLIGAHFLGWEINIKYDDYELRLIEDKFLLKL